MLADEALQPEDMEDGMILETALPGHYIEVCRKELYVCVCWAPGMSTHAAMVQVIKDGDTTILISETGNNATILPIVYDACHGSVLYTISELLQPWIRPPPDVSPRVKSYPTAEMAAFAAQDNHSNNASASIAG